MVSQRAKYSAHTKYDAFRFRCKKSTFRIKRSIPSIIFSNIYFLNQAWHFCPQNVHYLGANSYAVHTKYFKHFLHLLKFWIILQPKIFQIEKTELSASSVGRDIPPTIYKFWHTRAILCAPTVSVIYHTIKNAWRRAHKKTLKTIVLHSFILYSVPVSVLMSKRLKNG